MAAVLAVGAPGIASAEPSGGAGTAVSVSASAQAEESAYAFQDLSSSSRELSYADRKLGLGGRLVRHDPDGGPDVPVAGAAVDLVQRITQTTGGAVKTVDLPFATVVTDNEGRFSSAPKNVTARDTQDLVYPAGDFTVRMFAAHRIDTTVGAEADNWDTTVRYDDIPAKVSKVRLGPQFVRYAAAGGEPVLRAQGVAQRQDGVVWRPVRGVPVKVEYTREVQPGSPFALTTLSDADGSWVSRWVLTSDGDIVVGRSDRYAGDPFLDLAAVPSEGIQVGIPDHMTVTSGPYSIGPDRRLTASYTVKGAGDCVLEGQTMVLQRSADGRTGWQRVATVRTHRDRGSVWLTGGVDGYYRWYHAANELCEETIGYTKKLQRTATRVQSFNAAPEPVKKGGKLVISGVLQHRPDGKRWVPYAGSSLEVWLHDTKGTGSRRGW
ncbi:hypothetical protein ABZ883_02470 [Streptomyces sp. NPDC046977]|uniref:hypothetical protein n=1 Tax=Streptomyces sp. NPDC046977 TaxID=3154703 RepID=UPI0033C7F350